ncbi:MAG: DUF2849 domain-containing protein [Candidatus Rariloculaceae bacterium]
MQMIIASRLVDGRVVFLGEDSRWVDSIEEGVSLETEADTASQAAATDVAIGDCEIVDPYLIDVVIQDGARRPAAIREAIRAFGPTVRTDELDPNRPI